MNTARATTIAWGASPILDILLRNSDRKLFDYCIDASPAKHGTLAGVLPVYPVERLDSENANNVMLVNTGMSSTALRSIHYEAHRRGYRFGENYTLYSSMLAAPFADKLARFFDAPVSTARLRFAEAFNLNAPAELQTGLLANWLLLEALNDTHSLSGGIAEIGAYRAGNSCLMMQAQNLHDDQRPYYIVDTFSGFAGYGVNDPGGRASDYAYDYDFEEIEARVSVFPQAKLVRRAVPDAFVEIDASSRFSLVFYDCDLYRPAVDTLGFFWPRLEPGGYLVVHDYYTAANGWTGVAKAVDEFCREQECSAACFPEATIAVLRKNGAAPERRTV